MKKRTLFYLMTFICTLLLLTSFVGCDMFDDDDDDNNDIVDVTDDDLVGTWYRFSKTVNDTNKFTKSKMTLDENGTGFEFYEYAGDEDTPDKLYRVFDWETDQGTLNLTDRDRQEIIFEGDYFLGSGTAFLRLSDENGLLDVYIKEMEVQSEILVDEWDFIEYILGDSLQGTIEGGVELSADGAISWDGEISDQRWFNNGSYMVWREQEMDNYSFDVYHYNMVTSDTAPDTLFLDTNVLIRTVDEERNWESSAFKMTCIRVE